MAVDRPSVMAAPNRCQITAKIMQLQPSAKYPDKWELEIEILNSKALEGPNFAKPGEKSSAFTFEMQNVPVVGDVVTAEAEFVGSRGKGAFQLTRLAPAKSAQQ